MRVEVGKQIEKLNEIEKILESIGTKDQERISCYSLDATKRELHSCLSIVREILIQKNQLPAELLRELKEKERSELAELYTHAEPPIHIGDTLIYHVPGTKYYAPQVVTEIRITSDEILYCTDTPSIFEPSDIGRIMYRTMDEAQKSNE